MPLFTVRRTRLIFSEQVVEAPTEVQAIELAQRNFNDFEETDSDYEYDAEPYTSDEDEDEPADIGWQDDPDEENKHTV